MTRILRRAVQPLRGRLLYIFCGCLAGTGVAGMMAPVARAQQTPAAHGAPNTNETSSVPSRAGPLRTSFAPIVERVAPSVVNIFTTKTVTNQLGSLFDDPFFRRFFGDRFGGGGGGGGGQGPQSLKQRSLGSGVIVRPDGYILSNEHVVSGADEIEVTLAQGSKSYRAKVVGTDPKSDIAVLKVDAENLKPMPFGNSEQSRVGDVVLAIGNPFGVGQTVTMGIISATRRGGMNIEEYEDFIQTDAAINPGNSGGALVDTEGRLIGVNTAILSGSGGFQGVGFAVPAQMAQFVMEEILKHGRVIRGYLGVTIQDVTPGLAKQFELPKTQGALVGQVAPGSPGERAGLKNGDVIVAFQDKPVVDSRNLKLMVASTKPGSTVSMRVIRNGQTQNLNAQLSELKEEEEARVPVREPSGGPDLWSGVTLRELDPAVRQQLSLPTEVNGVLVANVDPASPAASAGLRPGDVIQEVNRQPVRSTTEARNAVRSAKDGNILLRVWSRGSSRYLVMESKRDESTPERPGQKPERPTRPEPSPR